MILPSFFLNVSKAQVNAKEEDGENGTADAYQARKGV
jgi:hypothetical protein